MAVSALAPAAAQERWIHMGEEVFRLTADQEQAVRAVGYRDRVCDTCGGTKKFTVPDANSPGGRLTRPCITCSAVGRIWATPREWERHDRGALRQTKTDQQIAEILKRDES